MHEIKTHQGDCLEIMKIIPEQSVDMVLCDLPYGVTQSKDDIPIDLPILWEHYKRITKPNACIALFAQGRFYIDLVNSNPKMFRYDLVWDKCIPTGFLNANRMPLRRHEQIAIFYRKMPIYHPQFTEGQPLHSKGKAYMEKEVINLNYGDFHVVPDSRAGATLKYPTSVLKYSKPHPSVALHRTEKPVALLEWLIKTYTDEGDVVLDNCAGSMSTAIACLNTGRHGIMIEKDPTYFWVGESRIKTYLSQKTTLVEKFL